MTRSAPRSREARTAVHVNRRTALELARIYVSSSAHTAALDALSELPRNGWDEETQLLRAEALIGLGRLSEAIDIVGLPTLPELKNVRELALWRFLLQLRIQHRRGDYRRVVEIGRTYFDAGDGIPSVFLARTAMVVAQSMLAQRAPGEARELYLHVLELYQQLGSKEGQVDALLGIANTHLLDCHWDKADALYEEARFRYEELGSTEKALAACINLGVIRVKRGEFRSGRDLLHDALCRATQLGARRRAMTIHLALAMAEIRGGDLQAARPHLCHVLRAARRDRVGRDLALALEFLGELHLAEGHWQRADQTLNRALAVAKRIAPDGDVLFEVLRRLAEASLGRRDLPAARKFALEARALAQRFGDTYEVATCERVLAEVEWRAGDSTTACRLIRSATTLLGRLGETFERGRVEQLQKQIGEGSEPVLVTPQRQAPRFVGPASSSWRSFRELERGPGRDQAAEIHRTGSSRDSPSDAPERAGARRGSVGGGKSSSANGPQSPRSRPSEDIGTSELTGPMPDRTTAPKGGDRLSPRDSTSFGMGARRESSDARELRQAGLWSVIPAMNRSLSLARAVAQLDVPIVLTGEPGSGLEGLGRLIHRWSDRPGVLLPFHCADLDPNTLESELFGRNGRSGIGRIADGGTVFLDGVSTLGPESQRRLAAWIRSRAGGPGEARVRIVAAIRARNDQYDPTILGMELRRELESVVVQVLPLRERREDIPTLVEDIVAECSTRFGGRIRVPGAAQIAVWSAGIWTGNLDGLRDAVERYVVPPNDTTHLA